MSRCEYPRRSPGPGIPHRGIAPALSPGVLMRPAPPTHGCRDAGRSGDRGSQSHQRRWRVGRVKPSPDQEHARPLRGRGPEPPLALKVHIISSATRHRGTRRLSGLSRIPLRVRLRMIIDGRCGARGGLPWRHGSSPRIRRDAVRSRGRGDASGLTIRMCAPPPICGAAL